MRQVFLQFPWIHAPTPKSFFPLFQRYGHYQVLKAGQAIYNGGTDGEVAWILSGLCAFRIQDAQDKAHYFTLVPAHRLVGNVDAYTASVVNVVDFAMRESEVLLLPRHNFVEALQRNARLAEEHTSVLVHEHESDMEGLFSVATDTLALRLVRLFGALLFRDSPRESFHWEKAIDELAPQPIPFSLTPTEIAKIVHASRTAVSLQLNAWERSGLIKVLDGERHITPELLSLASDWLESSQVTQPTVRRTQNTRSAKPKS